jgi:hypothetical protein
MGWDWLKTLEWYIEAYNTKIVDVYIQARLSMNR